ncbi:FAD/NAD(P)-binding domain-containing protein [Dichomitus squalens LYAD-421 SS1]|uniref:FAD/NAD(P)-binding domain-containing protein n=1 Tax=Dichomitus squalens (strain LYAD-421) TaxID=732165 RepID=UPI0004412718|nr:FAD/NAD(P)-binding domain-containing protein [Dichomitus squalens LYAD-421 SS1]EJF65173.1 FAD/NAD(P)-binding domain-containing protein [Dichomitus squalens LYAD-421 SS1]
MSPSPPKRICIVGAGASGMSAAYAFSKHPDKFTVTVFDKQSVAGGMATSIDIDPSKYGATYINDGVQGCSPAFANTLRMFKILGFEATEVGMQISFGKGEDFWSNVFPSKLVAEYKKDIAKFGRALSVIKTFEVAFAMIPVHAMLRIFRFSSGFGERMVYPLVALFFGTGNQTPYISSAILERVFMDPSMKLFEYNDKSLLASIPTMLAFPKLHDAYQAWKEDVESRGNVHFKFNCEVLRVVSRTAKESGPVQIEFKASDADFGNGPQIAAFDELILAIDADSALKLLGKEATWKEKRILGSVKYLYDVTITHNDLDYMDKYYEIRYNPKLNAPLASEDDAQQRQEMEEAFDFASKSFRPLYYTMQYAQDRSKIEMSFDLTHYQPQFRGEQPAGPIPSDDPANQQYNGGLPDHAQKARDETARKAGEAVRTGQDEKGVSEPPLEKHVFQTIFLDKDGSQDLWTFNEIDKDKRICEKWWKQQSHRWQHYATVVPWMMFINGKQNTHYAGAWSVLNMHELAVTSGFAAAYRLGADYPFHGDEDCERLFRLYLGLSHGTRMRKEDRKGFFA